jgi:hypothetical protein
MSSTPLACPFFLLTLVFEPAVGAQLLPFVLRELQQLSEYPKQKRLEAKYRVVDLRPSFPRRRRLH